MTREEQIKASCPYRFCDAPREFISNSSIILEDINARAYLQGAKWSDENPPWHKYPDEKPKKEGKYYAVYTFRDYEEIYQAYALIYWINNDWYLAYDVKCLDEVVAWIELPKYKEYERANNNSI